MQARRRSCTCPAGRQSGANGELLSQRRAAGVAGGRDAGCEMQRAWRLDRAGRRERWSVCDPSPGATTTRTGKAAM